MAKTVSALKARRNLGELLNRAYYKGEETIIEKKGVPVAKLTKLESLSTSGKDRFFSVAGVWKDIDTEKIKRKIKEAREDGSSDKKFLANW
jgi:prevent-host-death family protein